MSVQNLLIKAFLRLTKYKKRQAKLSFKERQAENLPKPPDGIADKFSYFSCVS
ncbi:MAG: hypothetical protein ABJA66_08890 [Actinomycetota bacterium]